MYLYLCYDASRANRSGRVDKEENWTFFLLVTRRPIAHTGRCVCIQYCVVESGMDTGQPLVTSNGI